MTNRPNYRQRTRPIRTLPPVTATADGLVDPEPLDEPTLQIPADWVKGQLLNVRVAGAGYLVTLLGEEFDSRYPQRCLEFGNAYECQQFVSDWYARQNHDPRA